MLGSVIASIVTNKYIRIGNRCGHDPKHPRLVSVLNPHRVEEWDPDALDDFGHHRKSHFYYEVDHALDDFYWFPKVLPRLGMHYKDEKTYRRRSEAREADVAVLKCFVHHLELSSRRFGYPARGGFVYYDIKFIMKKTGLSESRVKRSIKRLKAAGYIERERRWTEREFGKFKALTTSTKLADVLFSDLGLTDKLRAAAQFAYEKLKKQAHALKVSVSSMLKCSVDAVKKKQKRAATTGSKPEDFPEDHPEHYTCQLSQGKRKDFQVALANLAIDNPGMSKVAMYRAAFKAV